MRFKVKVCRSLLSKLKGLMFTRQLKADQALVLSFKKETKLSVHTFFVFYPIDILWVNSNGKIVDIRRNVGPFTPLLMPKAEAKLVIELKANAAKDIKIGNKIIISKEKLEIRSK